VAWREFEFDSGEVSRVRENVSRHDRERKKDSDMCKRLDDLAAEWERICEELEKADA